MEKFKLLAIINIFNIFNHIYKKTEKFGFKYCVKIIIFPTI